MLPTNASSPFPKRSVREDLPATRQEKEIRNQGPSKDPQSGIYE